MPRVISDEKGLPLNLIGRTPTVINKTLTTQNTEYDQDLPANTVMVTIQARGSSDIKLSFTETESGTTYITVKADTVLTLTGLDLASETLYMQSPDNTVVAEVLVWTIGE